jgi:hypothetical protein
VVSIKDGSAVMRFAVERPTATDQARQPRVAARPSTSGNFALSAARINA